MQKKIQMLFNLMNFDRSNLITFLTLLPKYWDLCSHMFKCTCQTSLVHIWNNATLDHCFMRYANPHPHPQLAVSINFRSLMCIILEHMYLHFWVDFWVDTLGTFCRCLSKKRKKVWNDFQSASYWLYCAHW